MVDIEIMLNYKTLYLNKGQIAAYLLESSNTTKKIVIFTQPTGPAELFFKNPMMQLTGSKDAAC
jgi:hypothetical protein